MLYMKTNINVYNNAPQGKFLIQIEKIATKLGMTINIV